ncbi:MAG TPA: mercuric transporter MerT family protein [Blastocatellia bacterium]|nr:mercuric transporter MerT family protein [Blastocatellia bacterium]
MRNPNRKVYGLSVGAILPAVGFSLTWFCWLPIAAGALGAGMAATGGVLTPLRPYLTAASVALLGVAFYQAYKRKNTECAPGEGCALGENCRRQRVVLWLVAIVTAALLTVGEWSSWVIYWML